MGERGEKEGGKEGGDWLQISPVHALKFSLSVAGVEKKGGLLTLSDEKQDNSWFKVKKIVYEDYLDKLHASSFTGFSPIFFFSPFFFLPPPLFLSLSLFFSLVLFSSPFSLFLFSFCFFFFFFVFVFIFFFFYLYLYLFLLSFPLF